MELISVIVPVYNVEQYLERCIASIAGQTYKNLEIILVDDGSTDSCPEICDKWAEKDSRIKVIHKENGGLSDARNAGMKIAAGELIGFVDSDDWIDENFYFVLADAMKKTGSDIAECDAKKIYENESSAGKAEKPASDSGEIFSAEKSIEELICDRKIKQTVYNKLYKKSVISGILFKKGKCNEDEFWTYRVLGNADKIVKLNYEGYFYLQRSGSIMNSEYSLKRLDAVEAKAERHEYIRKNFPELEELSIKNLWFTCIYHGQMVLREKQGEKTKAMGYLCGVIESHPCTTKKLTLKEKIWISLAKVSFEGTCRLRNFLKIGF